MSWVSISTPHLKKWPRIIRGHNSDHLLRSGARLIAPVAGVLSNAGGIPGAVLQFLCRRQRLGKEDLVYHCSASSVYEVRGWKMTVHRLRPSSSPGSTPSWVMAIMKGAPRRPGTITHVTAPSLRSGDCLGPRLAAFFPVTW